MADKHSEIEIKFDAEKVETHPFVTWCMNRGPSQYVHAQGPDVYYEQGQNVVRHRWSGGAGELTVKRRKSEESTIDRVEVDLRFGPDTSVNDVSGFLIASGWERVFTLIKNAHIFWFDSDRCQVTVVIYEVGRLDEANTPTLLDKRRFIEVEVEKGNDLTPNEAKRELENWRKEIGRWFSVGKPLNGSLYEIYSGRKYQLSGSSSRRRPARMAKQSKSSCG